jgi:nucleoid DNA-binding protein
MGWGEGMRIKSELDHNVAVALGLTEQRVSVITAAFVEELCTAIIEDGGFHLTGLGKLRMKFEKGSPTILPKGSAGPMRIKLYFSKSLILKRLIEGKYGIAKESSNEQAKR